MEENLYGNGAMSDIFAYSSVVLLMDLLPLKQQQGAREAKQPKPNWALDTFLRSRLVRPVTKYTNITS